MNRHKLWALAIVAALAVEALETAQRVLGEAHDLGLIVLGELTGQQRCPHHPRNLATQCAGQPREGV